jgi:hypothetical protein
MRPAPASPGASFGENNQLHASEDGQTAAMSERWPAAQVDEFIE